MEISLPVIPQQGGVAALSEGEPSQADATTISAEYQLGEYVSRLHAEGLYGTEFSDPTALGGRIVEGLQGYMDRANSFAAIASDRATMSGDMSGAEAEAAQYSEQSGLAPGPAESELAPQAAEESSQAAAGSNMNGPDLDRAVELLSRALNYSFETTLIGTSVNNLAQSTNKLLRGQ